MIRLIRPRVTHTTYADNNHCESYNHAVTGLQHGLRPWESQAMGAANAGGALRSSAHRARTCLRACWAFQRAGASGWAWRGGQGRRAKVGKYAASRGAEAVVSAPVHGVQCTSSIALDDGRGQELRPVRGKGVYVVSPFVVRHIVGAVGPMLGPGTVEVEKFNALFVSYPMSWGSARAMGSAELELHGPPERAPGASVCKGDASVVS